MILSFNVPSETAREIIRSLQEQLDRQESVLVDGETPSKILSMAPTALALASEQKGLLTRAYNILRGAEAGNSIFNTWKRPRPVRTLEQLCLLNKRAFREFGWAEGKAGKLIQAALARKGLKLDMSESDMQAYKEGTFQLPLRFRRMI